jgi:hypothetical protein
MPSSSSDSSPSREDSNRFESLKLDTLPESDLNKATEPHETPKIIKTLTAVEKRREEDLVMNRFSNKQKELLRQIGGLPKRALTVVSQSFRKQHTSNLAAQADTMNKNPFKLTKETVESQLDNAIKGLPQDLLKSRTEAVARKIDQGTSHASQNAGSRTTFNNKTARRL